MKSYQFSRRSFMSAIGGSVGLAALLKRVEAQAEGATAPKRLMVVHHPVGTIPRAWIPEGTGATYVSSRLLKPFEDAGLRPDMVPMYPFRFNLGGPGGGHEKGTVVMMTGTPTAITRAGQPETDDPCANGPSIDQLLLSKSADLSGAPIKSLYALCDDRIDQQEISTRCLRYSLRRVPVPNWALGDGPGEENEPMRPRLRPIDLYTDVFGTMMPGSADAEALKKALVAKKSVLDFSLRELARLRTLGPGSSKDLIEAHELAIRDLELEISGLLNSSNDPVACGIMTPPPNVIGGEGSSPDYDSSKLTESDNVLHKQIAELHQSVIRAAFRCDLTRVGMFQFSPGTNHIAFDGLWPDNPKAIYMHHPVSHDVNDGNIDGTVTNKQSQIEFLLRVEEWYAKQTADFINTLKNTQDIYGQPLLDNTIVPYVTEVGRATHRHEEIPVVIFGGKAMGIKGGQFLKPASGLHNDMWLSVAKALGVSKDQLKGERGICFDSGSYSDIIPGLFT